MDGNRESIENKSPNNTIATEVGNPGARVDTQTSGKVQSMAHNQNDLKKVGSNQATPKAADQKAKGFLASMRLRSSSQEGLSSHKKADVN